MFYARKLNAWAAVGVLLFPGILTAAPATKLHCELYEEKDFSLTHARAKDELGALACLGYLHGRDRAWQTDHLRRIALGQRSEVYGSDWVRSDFGVRLMGFGERAEALYPTLLKSDQARFEAYSEGITQGFKEALKRGVYEFKTFGYEPAPWKPWHSIALLLLQAYDQTKKNYEIQTEERERSERFGPQAEKLFGEKGLPWNVTILKSGEYPLGEPGVSFANYESAGAKFNEGLGSNNWVIASLRSQSGKAWLANDPHLTLKHPPFWYFTHVEGGELNVIGASIPGVPVIPSGSNEKVSWGLTNSYLNVAEISQVSDEDLKLAEVIRPLIWVKLGPVNLPFIFKTFERTKRVLPVMPLESDPGTQRVIYWSGFDLKGEDFKGFFDIQKAQSISQMDQALSDFRLPSWNYVFADQTGKIGFRAVGKVVRSVQPKTYGIMTRSLAEVEKERPALTPIEMPHVMNPPRGYVATANNLQWPSDGKYFIGRAQSTGFRALRIEELILKTPKHDLNTLKAIQCDVQAVDARFFVPRLLASVVKPNIKLSQWQQKAVTLLSKWDFNAGADCEACPIYRRWMENLLEGMNENALFRLLGSGGEMEKIALAGLTLSLKDLGVEK
ncbi:MAG: penicillin acylase family protein [Bdellovibrionota bacterium]